MKNILFFSIIHIVFLQTTKTLNLLSTNEEIKQKMFNIIKEHSKKYSPKLSQISKRLINNLNGIINFQMINIPITELKNLKSKYNLPQELSNQLSKIKYSDKEIYTDIKYHIFKNHKILDSIFGIAKREKNDEIFFSYIKGRTIGLLITQYIKVKKRKCTIKFLICIKKCIYYYVIKAREMNSNELNIIKNTLENKFYSILYESNKMNNEQIYQIFHEYTKKIKRNYPKNWNSTLNPNTLKTSIDFNIKEIDLNNIQNYLTNIKILNNIIKNITELKLNNNNNNINFTHIFSQSPLDIHLIHGLALKKEKYIILAYFIGKGEAFINSINCSSRKLNIFRNNKNCNKIILDEKIRKKYSIKLNPIEVQNISKNVLFAKFIEQLINLLNPLINK